MDLLKVAGGHNHTATAIVQSIKRNAMIKFRSTTMIVVATSYVLPG